MGRKVKAKCLDCGEAFEVKHGGGFNFFLVRCDTCGKTRSVSFNNLSYLEASGKSPGIASAERDGDERKQAPVEPVSEGERNRRIEAVVGRCRCRGKYASDAPPRCPTCRSTRLDEDHTITMLYD